jgi:hypothetical protein
MTLIMLKCPTTGLVVNTGVDVPSMEYSMIDRNTYGPCPSCGQRHIWSLRGGEILIDADHDRDTRRF